MKIKAKQSEKNAKEIKVFAPASVTNVSCGFDILGFALDEPGDEITLRINNKKGITISRITGDSGTIPLDPEKNTAGVSLISLVKHLKFDKGIELEIYKKIRQGSGLGSSAASAVASVFALNEILGKPLRKKDLLPFALQGEELTSGGAPHADNVAASLLGGFILVRSLDPIDVINIDYPKDFYCSIIHPHIEIHTSHARKILRKEILLADAVKQWGNIAALVSGLINGDYKLIKRSMEDFIIEPVRSTLIPGYYEIRNSAMEAGAIGCSISGSGPSIFALSKSKPEAEKILAAMETTIKKMELEWDSYISNINNKGPKVIS